MIVSVFFNGSQQSYDYRTKDESIKEGDPIIVDTPRGGYTVVKVWKVSKGNGDNLKRVVCKVDDADYRREMMI